MSFDILEIVKVQEVNFSINYKDYNKINNIDKVLLNHILNHL